MEVSAKLSNAPLSAQKARLVGDLIRGMPVDQALNVLKFSSKKGAAIVKKSWNRLSLTQNITIMRTLTNCGFLQFLSMKQLP